MAGTMHFVRACFGGRVTNVSLIVGMLLATAVAQNADALYQQGTRLFARHEFAGAIEAFSQSVKLRPEFAAAWKGLGTVYAAQGDYDSAEKPLRAPCELQPRLPA